MKVFIFFILLSIANKGNETKHVVAKGETLYSISKQYGMDVATLKKLNNFKDSLHIIRIGDSLKVIINLPRPAETHLNKLEPAISKEVPKKEIPKKETKKDSIFHKVRLGETVYSIVQKYPPLTVQELLEYNNLASAGNMRAGQKLFVGLGFPDANAKSISDMYKEIVKNPETSNESTERETIIEKADVKKEEAIITPAKAAIPQEIKKTPISIPEKTKEVNNGTVLSLPVAKSEKKETAEDYNSETNSGDTKLDEGDEKKLMLIEKFEEENGGHSSKCIAMNIPGSNISCALYNGSKEGSIIRVRNVKNNKAVYLKVIGKLPNTGMDKEVCIKISESASQKLKIEGIKFLVEIEY